MNIAISSAEPNRLSHTRAQSGVASAQRLSILLVNYNSMRFLAPCLESICRFAPKETQVILEDNASTDGSVEFVEKEYPWLQIVRSSRNLGFAGGNNLAGANARGKFLLLINTDTVLLESIAPAVDWLESHPAYGALTINMVDGERKAQACTGRFPSLVRLVLLRSMLVPPGNYGTEQAYDVDWVQGSFLLLRSDLWQALNGLDERYFMYAEDVDLCKRIRNAGFKCAYLPHQRYLHWGGYDVRRFPDQVRSLATYVTSHMSGPQLLLCRAVLLSGCLMRAAFFQAKRIVSDPEVNRTKSVACWRAFEALIQRQTRET
jgi:GT2 family glycosyltransferase